MDEFERRLSDDLRVAGNTAHASDAVGALVRRKVRRRKTIATMASTIPIILLVVGAVWVFNATDEGSQKFLEVDAAIDGSTIAPSTTAAATADPPSADPLRTALIDLGADVDGAPEGAATLGAARWCGVDRADHLSAPTPVDTGLCVVELATVAEPAVMVRVQPTIEGDPIVTVVRSRGTDLAADVFVDSSQDAFGAPGWIELECTLTPTDVGDPNGPLTWDGCVDTSASLDDPLVGSNAVVLAPGETAELEWPDASILDAHDRAPLYLVAESADDGLPVWGFAGEAVRNDGGTVTLQLSAPRTGARLSSTEFGEAPYAALAAGRYTVAVGQSGRLRDEGNPVVVELTGDTAVADTAAQQPTVDTELALLRRSGVGDVEFGLGREDAVAALEAEFGVPVVYRPVNGCATTGYAFVGDFLVAEFWGDESGADSGFEAWHYGGVNWFDDDVENGVLRDIGLTTETGIGIGASLAEVREVGGGASGGYDAQWGASIWFENGSIGGRLSADVTEPSPTVESISGGRSGNPARMVC